MHIHSIPAQRGGQKMRIESVLNGLGRARQHDRGGTQSGDATARRFVREIEPYGVEENVEARTAVWEAWRNLELVCNGSLDTTIVRDLRLPRHTTPCASKK